MDRERGMKRGETLVRDEAELHEKKKNRDSIPMGEAKNGEDEGRASDLQFDLRHHILSPKHYQA